jgi:hypothetical protein
MEDGGDVYFVDAWEHKLVYYAGEELGTDETLLYNMLQASGVISATTNIADLVDASNVFYRKEDYYFIGSAGDNGLFRHQVVASGDNDPENYHYGSLSGLTATLVSSEPDDDLWNYNLNRQ